jgi:hypothetical protein
MLRLRFFDLGFSHANNTSARRLPKHTVWKTQEQPSARPLNLPRVPVRITRPVKGGAQTDEVPGAPLAPLLLRVAGLELAHVAARRSDPHRFPKAGGLGPGRYARRCMAAERTRFWQAREGPSRRLKTSAGCNPTACSASRAVPWESWTAPERASSRRSLVSPFQHLSGSVGTPMKSAVGECLLDDVMVAEMLSERARDLGYGEVTT